MIEWLERVPRRDPFLLTSDRVWSYGETLDEISARVVPEMSFITPTLTADSVFDCLAGLCGGGLVALGPGVLRDDLPPPPGTCLVVYTSGTAGRQRGVRLTPGNLEAACVASVEHLGHGPADTWLLAMPLHHVAGLSILVRSAYAGGSVLLEGSFDPASFAVALRAGVSMVSVVPTMLRRLLSYDFGPFRGLRAVLVGGGPIPIGLLEQASEAGLPVLPTYGMTETFGQAATLRPGSRLEPRVHPLPGVSIRIEDDGRISVSGPQVSPGYLGEPDRASPWLTTNDLGWLDDDGALRVLGRADTIIITGGANVDPVRVENEIRACSGVKEAVVVGVPDDDLGLRLIAVYSGVADWAELAAELSERLPRYMVPRQGIRVSSVPLTSLDKPDRQAALRLAGG